MPGIFQKAFALQNQDLQRLVTRVARLETGEIRLRGGARQPTAGEFARIANSNLVPNDPTGSLDLRQTDITKLGSIPPTVIDGFSVVVTDVTANIYWDGTNSSVQIQIRRTDGSVRVIPPGNLAITGLVANTTYYMLPFWSTLSEGDTCGQIGWVAGTAGSPKFCFLTMTLDAVAAQALQFREPLAHPAIIFKTNAAPGPGTTTSSGGGSGTGGGTYQGDTGGQLVL